MPYCPKCDESFDADLTACPNCGHEFNGDEEDRGGYELIAYINEKTAADYARETLVSYDIPAVIISESGFFGQVGLNLPSVTGKGVGKFQVHVPSELREEAENILTMILGDGWEKAEKKE
ncbi:MAG: hypothetical protein CVT49_02160 [candidate division Zixibacteria bacterium HGW-Zixibacteria-1]|nr:MAG: hypothetical protein CVT49_02160 [candidate division Zixibacteria bacterium HGW-Zixibacteria-1]